MKKQLAELAERRRGLLEKIESQRIEVAEISRHWQKPLALADTGLKVVRFMRNYSGLIAGALTWLLALRRKGFAGLTQEKWRLL